MPNIRYLKKRENKTRKWTIEAMKQAVQEAKEGRLTAQQAAKQFGVPKSTLSDRLTGRVAVDSLHGNRTILSLKDEASLAEYCLYSANKGFPLTKHQVLSYALAIYNHRNMDKPKTMIGQTWWINFRERNQHRLALQTRVFTKKSSTMKGAVEDSTHPLVASGCVAADLAHILLRSSRKYNTGKVRKNYSVLMAKETSDVVKGEDNAAGVETSGDGVQQQGDENTSLAPGSKTSHWTPTSASHSPSNLTPISKSPHMNLPLKHEHQHNVEASSPWQTFSSPPVLPSPSSPSSAEPATSTGHTAGKRPKLERRILRCGKCRHPYPPQDPGGLVLWVQCDNCHKMFHTICVSTEMDLNDYQFWCFWCLDV